MTPYPLDLAGTAPVQEIQISDTKVRGVHGNTKIRPGDWIFRGADMECVGRLCFVVETVEGKKARSCSGPKTHITRFYDITGYDTRDATHPEPRGGADG